jgi:cation-transporting ATPase E
VDKTGTITEPGMEVTEVIPLADAPCEDILSALYGSEEPENDTARALAEHFPENPGWIPEKRIPFTSAAKWSGAVFRDRGAYLAGAPEVILGSGWPEIRYQAEAKAEAGDRVLLLARYDGIPEPNVLEQEKLTPLALVVLSGFIRENAKATFDYFESQGVSVRVISGDNALAASRIACRAGINGADRYIDASTLTTPEDIARAAESCHVFGRVTPDQKKAIVAAL